MRWLLALGLAGGVYLVEPEAEARPGGGQSYSGRRSRGTGGGGGFSGRGYSRSPRSDDGGDIGLLIYLLFRYPQIGVPVLLIIIVASYVNRKRRAQTVDWSMGSLSGTASDPGRPRAPARMESLRTQLASELSRSDINFSLVLFEDFVFQLFARVHELRGQGDLEAISAYLSPRLRQIWRADRPPQLASIENVVVGSMEIASVRGSRDPKVPHRVGLIFEANWTEVTGEGQRQAYYLVEKWTLSRDSRAQTRPPDALSVRACPNCGAALDTHGRDGRCAYCGEQLDGGRFDWVVDSVAPLSRDPRGPQLTGTVPEMGTHLPTLYAPNLRAAEAALRDRDPEFDTRALASRVGTIHQALNQAWTHKRWKEARPYVTDGLFLNQLYWIETYKAQGLTNVLRDVQLQSAELTALRSDRWFDAATLRIYATGKDYTVRDSDQRVVGGDPRRDRPYSEYWTLIRRSTTHGPARSEPNCPNCGAPLSVERSGACEYCGSKITSGEFDWVLSRIEQDEAYQG